MPSEPWLAMDPLLGEPTLPLPNGVGCGAPELLAEMDRLGVGKALVRHRDSRDVAPYFGNRTLGEEVAGEPRLIPCWMMTPDGEEPEFDPAHLVRQAFDAGARAAWMAPQTHHHSPLPWCCGDLFAALSAARMPLLLEYADVGWDILDAILSAFPKLRVVLLRIPRLGRDRNLYALLRAHAELYISCEPMFSVHLGLDNLVATFGQHRWVLGLGFPVSEGGCAVADLLWSGLADDAVRAVAYGNAQRLLGEVAV